jgi:hypothetical protein
MVLSSSSHADLAAIFRSDLNVPTKQGYNLVVKVHSRDYQTQLMKVTAQALLGYVLKDELKKHFRYRIHHACQRLMMHMTCLPKIVLNRNSCFLIAG